MRLSKFGLSSVEDLTTPDMVVKEEDVETFEYNPISYLQFNLDINIDAQHHFKSKKKRQNSNSKSKGYPNISFLNGVNQRNKELNGRARSKTLVERVEVVGERLKNAVYRTPSLEILPFRHKKHEKHSQEHQEIVDKLVPRIKVNDSRKQSLGIKNDQRSRSCSDFQELKTLKNHKKVTKTRSCEANKKKVKSSRTSGYSTPLTTPLFTSKNKPTITVNLADDNESVKRDYNSNTLKYRSISAQNVTASTASLYSFRSDYGTDSENEHTFSDSSSVFTSDNSYYCTSIEILVGQNKQIEENSFRSIKRNGRPEIFEKITTPNTTMDSPYSPTRNEVFVSTPNLNDRTTEGSNTDRSNFLSPTSNNSSPIFSFKKELTLKERPKSLFDLRKSRSSSYNSVDTQIIDDSLSLSENNICDSERGQRRERTKTLPVLSTNTKRKQSVFSKLFKKRSKSLPKSITPGVLSLTPDCSKRRVMIESIV